ncbi:MAG: phosphoglucomutase/phosphomannomutase family protein [Coriobacteriales bacterium]|nr:phosphoglucomutase/phosphomannomutase family protein [Coriobacteriales bacterium]
MNEKPLAHDRLGIAAFDPGTIRFGTDGWRAIIGEDFTVQNLARVAQAAAQIFGEDNPLANADEPPQILVGYDCRENASKYAALAAAILAGYGFEILLSNEYCPTPTLCWSIAQYPRAVGGLILTSSHNPAAYLGVKLRMSDGGASPKSFSDRVEAALSAQLPEVFSEALAYAETPDETAGPANLVLVDFMHPYLTTLATLVDAEAIAAANLRVVVDPMYGAGRGYLANLLRSLGVEVDEINAAADPTFAGLHPEPIPPWINDGLARVAELGYDACFITDGDADRIGAGARDGSFVNPHKILALVCALLVEDKGQHGSVVRTLSGSNLIKRQCKRFGLELKTTPVGFKWIYEEMLKGNVMLGGEESGGIGIPTHVRERDGLLMALLLTELMAKKGKDLGALVADLHETLGYMEYTRLDLKLTQEQKETFLREVCQPAYGAGVYQERFTAVGQQIETMDYRDGIKFEFASDAWLLIRPSGTEPLVRVYVEADTAGQVQQLLDLGCALAKGE